MQITIIGSGYVGIVTGVCFANLKNSVTFVDIDEKKLNLIHSGISPIYEKKLEELIQLNQKYISVSSNLNTSIRFADIVFVCVGTPPKEDGSADYSALISVVASIGESLRTTTSYISIVIKSTVLPGTTKNVIKPILEEKSGKKAGIHFGLAMNPEFLREGVAVDDFQNPDRIIIGFEDKESKARLDELYLHFNCNKLFTDCTSAEMIKFVSNAFLATKISFANEIGNICKQIGIDTEKVFEGVGMDSRINPAFFASGIGFGGSCFPKDVNALQNFANSKGLSTKMLSAVLDVNDDQPLQMIHLLKKYIPEISGSQIGILGLSFKPGTDDIRESRTIPIIRELLFLGAKVIAYDPLAQEKMKNLFPEITYADTSAEVLASDAVLITTAHQEFEELDYSGLTVIDGRRVSAAEKTAARYEGVCW